MRQRKDRREDKIEKTVEKTQIPSSSSCSQCTLNSNLCLCVYHLRQPLPKPCHREIVRQRKDRREDKIAKPVGKTFFYFASEAIKGENNTFTKEASQVDKKFQSDYNSCY